jgi:ankyrin repeat protein
MGTLLLRKADWHDYEGTLYLLEAGADPNIMTVWRRSPLQAAILRDNDLRHIVAMMEHGADPLLKNKEDGRSAVAMAAHRGRGDVLKLFGQWGAALELQGVDALIAACALNDSALVQNIIHENPSLLSELLAQGGTLLAEFSGVGNTDGVRLLLDAGVNIQASYIKGDGYFGIAHNSTALHVAAWRAQHSTLQLLRERGAAVNQRDGWGRTPLLLAVLACTDSYWSYRRSPASVKALLASGALTDGIKFPTGYDEIDALLAPYYA